MIQEFEYERTHVLMFSITLFKKNYANHLKWVVSNWLLKKKIPDYTEGLLQYFTFQTKDYFYLLYYFNNHDFIPVSFLHYLWPFTRVHCW